MSIDTLSPKEESAFSNLEDCGRNPPNAPVGKSLSANHLLPDDSSTSKSKRAVDENDSRGHEFPQQGEDDFESAEPSIGHSSLVRVLKLCGLNAPPPKLTYRTSNGVPVEYSGNKLTLREYLDFADVYVDDTALQKFMSLFKLLPGRYEERNDVMNALKCDREVYQAGDVVYLISER